ncbi:MAG TPA: DUF1697 domain-containing protein [Vicinamibacterales bacterium]|nr:DUF1697 domain-containing protein [Vicinamibacterales bacterium]
MTRYVAFLRAINVGGHIVKMDALRKHFTSLGFDDVETFIASGNVIFRTRSNAAAALERRIEACLEERLGYEVKTFLRTDAEVAAIAAHRAFEPARVASAGSFNVGFLAGALDKAAITKVKGFVSEIDDFHVNGRELYWLCRTKQSDSKFSNAAFERVIGVRSTFRGLNTIRRLAENLALP